MSGVWDTDMRGEKPLGAFFRFVGGVETVARGWGRG
jgi:hypothetical protein